MKINLSEDDVNESNAYDEWSILRKTKAHADYDLIYASLFLSHIVNANYLSLTTLLRQYESIEVVHQHLTGNRLPRKEFMEVTGLFINYIASALALRDSTRNITKNSSLFSKLLSIQESERVAQNIAANPKVKLPEDIRNIISHQSLLIPSLAFNINHNESCVGFAFSVKKLLDYERLSAPSKNHLIYLTTPYIYLKPLIDDYHHTVSNHQSWIIRESLNKHKIDYPQYWKIRNHISTDWSGDLELI